MAKAVQLFSHNSPSAPTLTKGMVLGASGVTGPPLRRIGAVLAGSGNGAFNASAGFGFGQHDGDLDGNYYVCDNGNSRVQMFDSTDTYVTQRSATQLFGSSVAIHMVVVDRARNEIHIGAGDLAATNTHIYVWALSLGFANFTSSNYTRRYGSNGSVGSGITTAARALTLFGDYAVICSSSGARKVVIRNHLDNTLVAEVDWTGGAYRFSVANGKLYGGGVSSSGVNVGLREISLALASVSRLDPVATFADGRWGVLSMASTALKVQDAIGYNGKVYLREYGTGRVVGWNVVSGAWADTYLSTDGEPADTLSVGGLGGSSSPTALALTYGNKLGIQYAANASKSDYLFHWAAHVNGVSDEAFLAGNPLSVATATWIKNDWSAGTNTLQGLSLDGVNLSAEKWCVRLRKNGGTQVTLRAGQLFGAAFTAAISGLGTFTGADELELELDLSTHERLDGHATLSAVRDKTVPTNISAQLLYDDSVADVYVPYPSSGFQGRAGGTAAARGRVSF